MSSPRVVQSASWRIRELSSNPSIAPCGCTWAERGVSVSADDVALIEHVRQLRSVEAALSSAISSTARANIVEQLERCRWFHREQEIEEYETDPSTP